MKKAVAARSINREQGTKKQIKNKEKQNEK